MFGSYNKLEIHFIDGGVTIFHKGVDIREYDKIWLSSMWQTRDIAYAVHLYLEANKISHTRAEQATSKVTDQMKVALAGLKTPNTWYSTKSNITNHVKNIESICKYPLVIKDTIGSRGRYASFISNVYDLVATSISLDSAKKYLYQEFIPNDYEWGVLIANGQIVSAEKSYPKVGEYRNNACNGATEVFVPVNEIPKNIQELTLKAAKVLDLDWSRVDILEDKNTGVPYILEANRYPGITTKSDEVTGAMTYLQSVLEG